MLNHTLTELGFIFDITLFSDKCTFKEYEKLEAEFDKDLHSKRGKYRFDLSKFVDSHEKNKDAENGAEEESDASKAEKKKKKQLKETTLSTNPKLNVHICSGLANQISRNQ